MQILTHRGLEPLNRSFHFAESTKGAFTNHLQRGYGLEFDVNFTRDGICFIFHDSTIKRLTNGTDSRETKDITWHEFLSMSSTIPGAICTFDEILSYIDSFRKIGQYSALHLKGKFQKKEYLDVIITTLRKYPLIEEKIFVFDAKIHTAQYLKQSFPQLKIFPSVAHFYDIKRYNQCTGNTLLSVQEVLDNVGLFSGVWLDEWDKKDENGKIKTFYNQETFSLFRSLGLEIGLVTPELHATSPGLLGSEAHEDAINIEVWTRRMKEILSLNPDYVCTDYLEALNKL